MENPNLDPTVTRRTLLGWVIGGLGAAIAVVLGGAGLGYFASPAFKRKNEDWVDIGAASDIPLGVPTKVDFVERSRDAWVTDVRRSSAWLMTANGRDFVAYDPRCTHLGCPYHWDGGKKQFVCPCHSAVFGMDGSVVSGPPPRPLDHYPVKLVDGRLLILPRASQEKNI